MPRAVQDYHDLLLRLLPHPDKFHRARRFTLAERLEGGLLDVPAELTAACSTTAMPAARARACARPLAGLHPIGGGLVSHELSPLSGVETAWPPSIGKPAGIDSDCSPTPDEYGDER